MEDKVNLILKLTREKMQARVPLRERFTVEQLDEGEGRARREKRECVREGGRARGGWRESERARENEREREREREREKEREKETAR